MKKSLLNKSIASALLLVILTLSATATAASGKKNTIYASAGPNGTIDPCGEVRVKPGEPQKFDFSPSSGYHISSIVVDGVYESGYAESYTFDSIKGEYHTITVYFSANKEAAVPEGTGVTVFINSEVILTLDVTASGDATLDKSFPDGIPVVNVWEINTDAVFDGKVLVALHYDPLNLTPEEQSNLRLIRGDSLDAVCSDVNNDLVVDGTDVSIVANAVKQPYWYKAVLDVNNDGFVNEDDVHMVNENRGATLTDITYGDVDIVNHIIYGITDHFCLFRAH
jgi:hypothetical protein